MGNKAVHPSRLSEILLEDDCVYSREELKDMLEMIHEGNKAQGGLVRLQTGFGILGFVRFLDCYYLLLVRLFHRRMYAHATRFVRVLVLLYLSHSLPRSPLPAFLSSLPLNCVLAGAFCQVTQRRKVGSIGGNTVYGIKATEMVAIKPAKEASTQSWGKQVRDSFVGRQGVMCWAWCLPAFLLCFRATFLLLRALPYTTGPSVRSLLVFVLWRTFVLLLLLLLMLLLLLLLCGCGWAAWSRLGGVRCPPSLRWWAR